MALVDYEGVVLDLESWIASKNAFGQRELLAKLAELRGAHRQTEGLPERAGRLYLPGLLQELTERSASAEGVPSRAVANGSAIAEADQGPEGES